MRYHQQPTPGRPPLEPLPIDERQARTISLAKALGGRPSSPEVLRQMAQIRVLLADGERITYGDVAIQLKIRPYQAKWALRRLRLAGEIEPTDDRGWRRVTKALA